MSITIPNFSVTEVITFRIQLLQRWITQKVWNRKVVRQAADISLKVHFSWWNLLNTTATAYVVVPHREISLDMAPKMHKAFTRDLNFYRKVIKYLDLSLCFSSCKLHQYDTEACHIVLNHVARLLNLTRDPYLMVSPQVRLWHWRENIDINSVRWAKRTDRIYGQRSQS